MPWVDLADLVRRNPPTPREAQQVLDYLARRAKARFYADENFPPKAVEILRKMGAQVRTAHEEGLAGREDEDHAAFARKHGLILLSCDRDFLNERRFPLVKCPAIFVLDLGSGSDHDIRQTFRCLSTAFRVPQFFDQWWKIDAKPEGWTEYVRHLDGTTSRSRHRLWRGRKQEWN